MATRLTKSIRIADPNPAEAELMELIEDFTLPRVLKLLRSRKRQLERQRTPEYREQTAARAKAAKEADRRKIEELQRKLAQLRGISNEEMDDQEEEHAA